MIIRFYVDKDGKIRKMNVPSVYDTRKISNTASAEPSVIEKKNYILQQTAKQALKTGQIPTFPKGTEIPDISNIVGVDESGNREMDFSDVDLSQSDKTRILNLETSLQKQLEEFGVGDLREIESLYDPMSYGRRRKEIAKLIPKQEAMRNIILNYGNMVAKQRNVKQLTYPPVRKTKEFLVNYHADDNLRELPNSLGEKSDAEKKEIKEYYKKKTLPSTLPTFFNFEGKTYTSKDWKIVSRKGEKRKVEPRTGEERVRKFTEIGKGRPYFLQTIDGVRILGFRDQASAEMFGMNYLTKVDPKTGKPRWVGIAKSKSAKLIIEKLKDNISEKKGIDRRDINLNTIKKYYPPSIWFWTDNVAKAFGSGVNIDTKFGGEGRSMGKKPRQVTLLEAKQSKKNRESYENWLKAQEKAQEADQNLTEASEKLKESNYRTDKRSGGDSYAVSERKKLNESRRRYGAI